MLNNTISDSKKRYNLIILDSDGDKYANFKNVQLVTFGNNFIQIIDDKGKEHFYTGNVGICLDEA